MTTIELTLYNYSELSEKAKLTALIDYQCEAEYFYGYDALEGLKRFMIAVGVDMYNYDIDWLAPKRSKVYYEGEPTADSVDESKFGYFAGITLAETFNKTKSIEQAVQAFFKDCADDYEYQLSEEGFAEHCDANDFLFYENGKLFV